MGLSGSAHPASQQTSVEELLAFIEGEEGDGGCGQGGGDNAVDVPGGSKSTGKKGKKKPKKPVHVSLSFVLNTTGPERERKCWFVCSFSLPQYRLGHQETYVEISQQFL